MDNIQQPDLNQNLNNNNMWPSKRKGVLTQSISKAFMFETGFKR